MTNLDQRIHETRFVVVDVESAGGASGEHRIIEVGMVVVERGAVVRTYSSLVNPHEEIPEFITTMTGISNAMVVNAPDEDDALAPVREELSHSNAVFVGHNVGFDWSCVSKSLARCGYVVPDIVRLCTCKLARCLYPETKRHDLATVAAHCHVDISSRHRALGDAEATAEVLLVMLAEKCSSDRSTLADLMQLQYMPRLNAEGSKKLLLFQPYLTDLPSEPGVYYFFSAKGKLLYVGKARNLASRVRSYFNDAPLHGRGVTKMIKYVKHIEWRTTGTELAALMLESREIKEKHPSYNVMSREYIAPWFITFSTDDYPTISVVNTVDETSELYYGPFRSQVVATRLCEMIRSVTRLRTCKGMLKPRGDYRPCFDYHIGKCDAPCAMHQTAQQYQEQVRQAKTMLGRVEDGAIEQFRTAMDAAAEALDFEHAALYRDGIREIERMLVHSDRMPLSLRDLNIVVAVASIHSSYTVEIFALRGGKLCLQTSVAKKDTLDHTAQRIRAAYDNEMFVNTFSRQDLEDLRIITSWMHQHKRPHTTFVVNGQSVASVQNQLHLAVLNATK